MTPEQIEQFHRVRKNSKGQIIPIDTKDSAIVRNIVENIPFLVFEKRLLVYINGYFEDDVDGCITKSFFIQNLIYPDLITSVRVERIFKLLLTQYTQRVSLEDLNVYPSYWIPFQNGMLNVKTMTLLPHSQHHRNINLLPHRFQNRAPTSDSIVRRFLETTIPDPDDREMFLQYCGYCFTTATHLQKFLIICGTGGTGKSVLLRLVQWSLGHQNYSNVPLQDLNDRFSSTCLIGKLANIYADLPSSDMKVINGIKTITGGDAVKGEYKGGKIFSFTPYCKLLFSANRIPKSRDDATDAYYRRLLILRIKERGEEIADLERKLEEQIDDFIFLCVEALNRMYTQQNSEILVSENCKREIHNLYLETDTVEAWLSDANYFKDPDSRIERRRLFGFYEEYCRQEGREHGMLSANGFYSNLREKGFREVKSNGEYFFFINQKQSEFVSATPHLKHNPF